MSNSVPYANASSGDTSRGEIMRILRRLGASSIGFMDDFDKHELVLVFVHRERQVRLSASASGWASFYLRENPWNRNRRSTPDQWRRKALDQGMIAINSVLRDWVKGQVTAVECGILSFEAVFMPHMLMPDGRTLLSAVIAQGLLPAPENADD